MSKISPRCLVFTCDITARLKDSGYPCCSFGCCFLPVPLCRKEPQSSRELILTHRGCMMSHVEVGQLGLIVPLCRLGLAGVHCSGGAGKAVVCFLPGGLTYSLFALFSLMMCPFSCRALTSGISSFFFVLIGFRRYKLQLLLCRYLQLPVSTGSCSFIHISG